MTADEPRNALRAHDPGWLTALPRARESDKRAWATLCCLIAQRRPDGVAPVVLETAEGGWIRCPLKYEAAFELCLRHLHNQHTPLGGESCTIGALLANRAAEALKLPGRWVPLPDGSVEERAGDPAPDDAPPETPDDAPPEIPDVPPEIPDVPPEIPDATPETTAPGRAQSALPDYSESPRCCRSPWAPCGSRGERPYDSRGRCDPSDSRGRCGPSETSGAGSYLPQSPEEPSGLEAPAPEAPSDAGSYLPQHSEDEFAEIPRSLPGIALAAPLQGAPEMSQSSSRRRQRHLRRRARKMALRAAP